VDGGRGTQDHPRGIRGAGPSCRRRTRGNCQSRRLQRAPGSSRRQGEAAWREAENLIATKKPRDYDLAVALLRGLSALARRDGDHDTFTVRFLQLRSRHERKPSLLEHFDKARFPQHL
jgi:hypothetical protein